MKSVRTQALIVAKACEAQHKRFTNENPMTTVVLLDIGSFKKKINVYLFLRQKESESVHMNEWGRSRKREGDTESKAGSRL